MNILKPFSAMKAPNPGPAPHLKPDSIMSGVAKCLTKVKHPGSSSPSRMTSPPPLPVFQPLPESGRQSLPDVWRGFALLGIFVVNMAGMKMPFEASSDLELLHAGPLDHIVHATVGVLFSGKFVTIFTLVFGLGMGLQKQRAEQAGREFGPFQRRRMLVLLVMGILHGILLWAGDILAVYALYGLVGMAILRVSPRRTLQWAVGGMALGLVLAAGLGALGVLYADPSAGTDDGTQAAWIAVYQQGSWQDIIRSRTVEWLWYWFAGLFSVIPWLFCTFLTGLALAKTGFPSNLDLWYPGARRYVPICLVLGLAAACGHFPVHHPSTGGWLAGALGMTGYFASMPLLAFCYVMGLTALVQGGRMPRLTGYLAAAGRLSLSHYLLQSLLANVLFMGWGLGLYGKVGTAAGVLVAIAFYGLQLLVSPLWLRHFETGPAEWLWRTLAYGKRPRFRRRPAPSQAAD